LVVEGETGINVCQKRLVEEIEEETLQLEVRCVGPYLVTKGMLR
jgi:hypothetical protein